jgi:hypothetical protein
MQHKGIIGFPFFYFLRIMISDFQVSLFFSSLLYNFLLNCDAGPCFVAWILLVCYMELRGAWTWLGSCNSLCCGLLELYSRCCRFCLLFGVDLSYIFSFCTFTASSFANVGLGFVFHIHFQGLNIYILRFLHFEIHWDLVLIFVPSLGICWNLVLESFVEFEFQIQEILKFWF